MIEREYPILEFDEDKDAFIRPERNHLRVENMPERCVLCFFSEAIEKLLSEVPHEVVATFKSESMRLPVYAFEHKGERIALIQAGVGAPIAGGQIDELTARGVNKFFACGSCGVLEKEIAVGHLIIPVSAVRDEGMSYHYVKPSREIEADPAVVEKIERVLTQQSVPYIKAKTWTTDAFYRETPRKIAQRKKEGCVTVEMETSAYLAVAQYNGVAFGQILYAGDNLGGDVWDSRGFSSRTEIREFVLRLALDVCAAL